MRRLFPAAGETAATPRSVSGVQSLRIPHSKYRQLKEATMKGWMSRVRPSTHVSSIVLAALALTIGALLFGGGATAAGPPADLPGVPHYFGPFPNWANSPLAQPAATVTINGNGAGAQATATVGANGAVTGLTITATGGGYTTATVSISGPGSGATATAFVQRPARSTRSRSRRAATATRPPPSRSAAAERRRRQRRTRRGGSTRSRLRSRGAATRSRRCSSGCRTPGARRRRVTPPVQPRIQTATSPIRTTRSPSRASS